MCQHIIVSVARIAYALPAEGDGLQWMASIESVGIYGPDISKNVTIINLFFISCSSNRFIHSFFSEYRTPYPPNVTAFNGAFIKAAHPMLVTVLRDKDK
jgi:hypothetical protein